MGRPENRRKRTVSTIMNEKEEQAFLEYFCESKTNREVTGKLCSNSVKNIDSKIGRYCNKFTHNNWLNKVEEYLRYEFITPLGERATKGKYVPAYKANIKPMLDYFLFTANDGEIDALFSNKYSFPILYLFFELDEVRSWVSLLAKVSFGNTLNIYNAFQKVLDRELIYNWLYFERRFYPELSKIVSFEEIALNHLPDVITIKKMIEKYLKDKRPDFEKFQLRTEISEKFNSSWDEFKETKLFEKIKRINHAQNKSFPRDLLEKEIKIKYFSRLLHIPSTAKAIKTTFLGRSANALINLQNKSNIINENKTLKYQLFSKPISS